MPTQAYRPRRPAATVLHHTVREHLETYLANAGCDDDLCSWVPPHVEQAFRAFLRCGILAHGLARAYCHGCGHDFSAVTTGTSVPHARRAAWPRRQLI